MAMSEVRVFAPATVANVAVGFDVLGFALDAPGDEVVVRAGSKPGLYIKCITGTGDKVLPLDPLKNTAGVAALRLLEHIGESNQAIEMEIHKKMPFGSGLGSSAASAAAGVVAVNEWLGNPLTKLALLPFAVEGEQAADGAYHADNVGPSLLGGMLFIRNNADLDVFQLPIPDGLFAAVVHPAVEVLTKDARDALSKDVALGTAIVQTGNLGAFIHALHTSDFALMSRSLKDVMIEPQRAKLIPGFATVKEAALEAGALGSSISGAGPSVFALCQGEETARSAAAAMEKAFAKAGVKGTPFVSAINKNGAIRIA